MAHTENYDPESVTQFLSTIADRIDECVRKASPSPWTRAQERSWLRGPDGGILAGAVHSFNMRLIVGASPDAYYRAANLFRTAAALPPGTAPDVVDAAVDLALHYDQAMKFKASSLLQPVAA